ncbi:Dcp1-like decapping family protein [Gregarina niphandrodes]|uniref:Dcp1-like decapping family protein n=1 Tax=Gregarina niphandrodes TaxID=110365 RepID=A0A023B356_GRENI|nr:Dcp1-like decapping family protein [Gregarina niphandrodes]EZG55377.1 Dcp1-like decapping family protein [Gregarina niphandrodes]|eukprot:XP_011131601.1 Dcp1-like decapping family protein [Gregarina niphandrodes]
MFVAGSLMEDRLMKSLMEDRLLKSSTGDMSASGVLDRREHVTLYNFDERSSKWVGEGLECSCFILDSRPPCLVFLSQRPKPSYMTLCISCGWTLSKEGVYVYLRITDRGGPTQSKAVKFDSPEGADSWYPILESIIECRRGPSAATQKNRNWSTTGHTPPRYEVNTVSDKMVGDLLRHTMRL